MDGALAKRDNFRRAFADFDVDEVAAFGSADVVRLLQDSGIVRHRGKIEAVINNAARARELATAEGTLARFFWRYADKPEEPAQTVLSSAQSVALSKELKRRGWKFVGPTTVYSFMQAAGMVNDHVEGCFVRGRAQQARTEFVSP